MESAFVGFIYLAEAQLGASLAVTAGITIATTLLLVDGVIR
jgi:hypothetical protein